MREAVRGPSRTAVLTAVARALHREEPRPWVIDDYLAMGLAGREGRALLGQLRTEVPRPYLLAFSRWMCVRARYTEDIVEQAAVCAVGRPSTCPTVDVLENPSNNLAQSIGSSRFAVMRPSVARTFSVTSSRAISVLPATGGRARYS